MWVLYYWCGYYINEPLKVCVSSAFTETKGVASREQGEAGQSAVLFPKP